MFFQGKAPVHQSMRRLVKRLQKANIPHPVVGGMAVFVHGYRRTTDHLDILLSRAGYEDFRRLFVPKYYSPVAGRGRRFQDRANEVTLDILVTGLFPGSGKPGPIAHPDPEQVRELIKNVYVIDLVTLITLELAARRHQDFADVVNLIAAHDLDEAFGDQLHASLRRDDLECLDEKRREDEYHAREG